MGLRRIRSPLPPLNGRGRKEGRGKEQEGECGRRGGVGWQVVRSKGPGREAGSIGGVRRSEETEDAGPFVVRVDDWGKKKERKR